MSASILQAQKVNIYSQDRLVLGDINLDIHDLAWFELVGDINSGKSLFLKTLYGQNTSIEGILKVLDYSLNPISVKDKMDLRKKIGYVAQIPYLLEEKTVRVNISLALTAAEKIKDLHVDDLIKSILDQLGIIDLIKREVSTLSMSEKILVTIARALIHKPRLILIDEVLNYLGIEQQNRVLDLLYTYTQKEKACIISAGTKIITRDLGNKQIFYIKEKRLIEKI